MKKVAVSACLLGEYCRYDGATKQSDGVIEAFKDCEVIPFCPEAPVLGTPRERISIISMSEGYRLIGDESGRDVTKLIEKETQKLIDAHDDLDMIVLKSKSPSCGLGTTPVLGSKRQLLCYDNGVAAQMLKRHFTAVTFSDERIFETEKEEND
jgi:uncharacterized protein YbbK (DUF523 family)